MFFHFVKYKLDTIKLKTKLFAGSKRGTLFAAFLRAVSYIAIQGEIPMINSFNLFGREADTSFGWNLILVNDDYRIPRNYEVELTELSNGEKWIRESILSFSRCSMMPELRDLNYL